MKTRAALALAVTLLASQPARADFMDGYRAMERGDVRAAIAAWSEAAAQGDAASAYNLGKMSDGSVAGIPRDDAQTLKWYLRSAELGLASGQYNAALYYMRGLGAARNLDKAAQLFAQAAGQGHANAAYGAAQVALDLRDPPRWQEGRAWLDKAIKLGNAEALCTLGRMTLSGEGGIVRNAAEGVRLFRLGAEKGADFCQGVMGYLYENGEAGLPADLTQAAKWYRLAADGGSGKAMLALGDLELRMGHGAEASAKAAPWYLRAAKAGNPEGARRYAALLESGDGVAKDVAEARRWYQIAAQAGNTQAAQALQRLGAAPAPSSPARPAPNDMGGGRLVRPD